jgi:hypothetical protein
VRKVRKFARNLEKEDTGHFPVTFRNAQEDTQNGIFRMM